MTKVKCPNCESRGNVECQTCRGHGVVIVSRVDACGGGGSCAAKSHRVTGKNNYKVS